jgi:hypothetical protein
MEFEHAVSAFERTKAVDTLEGAATVISDKHILLNLNLIADRSNPSAYQNIVRISKWTTILSFI